MRYLHWWIFAIGVGASSLQLDGRSAGTDIFAGLTPPEISQLESIPDRPKIVMATVYLKSERGRSILREGKAAPIDPRPYLPSSANMKKAVAGLERLGFKIEARGVTVSISGPPELFERTCGVTISLEERMVHEPREAKPETQLVFKSSQPVMHIKQLDDVIDGMILSTPGIPFD